jgi:hypothetical protein
LLNEFATVNNEAMTETPNRKRRWFQFSLRSLLVFTAICAIVAGWIGRGIERRRREREIVAAIQNLGGSIDYDFDRKVASRQRFITVSTPGDFFNDPKGVSFYGTGTDAALKVISQLPHLKKLVIRSSPKVTDAGLASLSALPELQSLELSGTRITDSGLEQISKLTDLQVLDLAENHEISNSGFAKLKSLTNLRTLLLFSTDVGDEGVAALADLPQLSVLYLGDTKVTDEAVASIKNLKQLEELYLEFTDISEASVAEIHAALPNCNINHLQIRHLPLLSERIPSK